MKPENEDFESQPSQLELRCALTIWSTPRSRSCCTSLLFAHSEMSLAPLLALLKHPHPPVRSSPQRILRRPPLPSISHTLCAARSRAWPRTARTDSGRLVRPLYLTRLQTRESSSPQQAVFRNPLAHALPSRLRTAHIRDLPGTVTVTVSRPCRPGERIAC